MVAYRTWARSILAPRERLLPGLGARLDRHSGLAVSVLMTLRLVPPGRSRAAVFRNVAKPLLTRMRSPLEVPVTGGLRMVVDPSDLIGRELAIAGVWEPGVTAVFRALLSPGDVCVDVGANIGYFTLLASRLVGPTGRVYALEPSADLNGSLRANIQLNGCTNVSALPLAASDKSGEARLHEGPGKNRGAATIRGSAAGGTSVQTCRVDAIVPAREARRVRLVKVDVEGSELEVLRGLEGLFERGAGPAIVCELTPAWSGEEASSFLSSFSERYHLKPYRLPRERLLSGRSGPTSPPLELASISSDQEELLLLPEGTAL